MKFSIHEKVNFAFALALLLTSIIGWVSYRSTAQLVQTAAEQERTYEFNLIGNAVKFTEKGYVRVRVEADPESGLPVRLEIIDSGIGIPADRLEAIFGAFEQADESIGRKYGGTGLGLTISRSLCRLMGYRLEVSSEPGRGSTFSVLLNAESRPVARPAAIGSESSPVVIDA